jgi:hypothetical protein
LHLKTGLCRRIADQKFERKVELYDDRYDRSTFYGGDAQGYTDYPAAYLVSAA